MEVWLVLAIALILGKIHLDVTIKFVSQLVSRERLAVSCKIVPNTKNSKYENT